MNNRRAAFRRAAIRFYVRAVRRGGGSGKPTAQRGLTAYSPAEGNALILISFANGLAVPDFVSYFLGFLCPALSFFAPLCPVHARFVLLCFYLFSESIVLWA